MLRQKIFNAFLKLSLCLLFFISASAFLVNQYLRTQDELNNLKHFSEMISWGIETHGCIYLDQVKSSYIRITLIDIDGTVRFDNRVPPYTLENHIDRTEIKDALTIGTGNSRRYSASTHKQTFYHALRLDNGQILRVSFTSDSLLTYTMRFMFFILLMIVLVFVFCYYLSVMLSRNLIEPINSINLNKLNTVSFALHPHPYTEMHPFLLRIMEQQRKIDEQIDELRRKNHEFQIITRSMSDGLILLNAQRHVLFMNKVARKIFNSSKNKEQNTSINQNTYNNNSQLQLDEHNANYLEQIIQEQEKRAKSSINIIKEGRDYEVRFNRIKDHNSLVGYALLILDITEKKRTEQMRQEFTANVSHELKTPLQSIIGYSELMASGMVQSKDMQPFASKIQRQSTRLKSLIEDIIFLSYLDESHCSFIEHFSITKICAEVFDSLHDKAEKEQIQLELLGDDFKFIGAKRYIYELIYNLVDNGLRYNQTNGKVSIRLSSIKDKDTRYIIEVRDTGIGIAPEEQIRIFERFYRVDKSHSRKTGGTGLGLSIVKRVVLFHQGKIKVQSALNAGTTFTITFYKSKLKKIEQDNQNKNTTNTLSQQELTLNLDQQPKERN